MADGLFEQSFRLFLRFQTIELVGVFGNRGWGNFAAAQCEEIGEAIPRCMGAADAAYQNGQQNSDGDGKRRANPGGFRGAMDWAPRFLRVGGRKISPWTERFIIGIRLQTRIRDRRGVRLRISFRRRWREYAHIIRV